MRANGRVAGKRVPKRSPLPLRERPGECVQVDVKFVRIGRQHACQYTAIDDCTRYRVLRLYPQLNHRSSLDFVHQLRRALPFAIERVQTDNGPAFSRAFKRSVEEAGIAHRYIRYIRPRRPQRSGKVEHCHRIDNEEFWLPHTFPTFAAAAGALHAWEQHYNCNRFSIALKGRTPAKRLADFRAAA